MIRSRLWLLSVALNCLSAVLARPQQLPLASCRTTNSQSLGESSELLNFTQAFVQFDQGQSSKGQLVSASDRDHGQTILRIVAPAITGDGGDGFNEDTNYLSTVVVNTRTLNFDDFTNSSALCSTLAGGCPYDAGNVLFGLQIPLDGSFAFTDLYTKVTILDTSSPSRQLACFHLTATPYYPNFIPYKVILWAPVALTLAYLVLTWIARIWTAYNSSMLNREVELASSLVSKLSANGIRERWAPVVWDLASGVNLQTSQPLRRFATPAARDVLWFVQFFTMLGMVAVQWPDYFYPVVEKTAWSSLAYNITLAQSDDQLHDIILDTTPDVVSEFLSTLSDANASTYLDENLAPVLLTIDGAQGLERFASVVGVDPRDLWPNAAAIFLMLCAGVVLFSTAALAVSAVFAQRGKTPPGVQPTRRVPSHGALDDMTGGHASYLKEEEDDFALKQSNNPWIQSSSPDGINWDWHFRMFCGNLLRVTLLFQLPIVIFSSFQIALLRPRTDTFPASKVSVALAVLLLLFVTLFPFWALWRVHVNSVRDTAGKVPPLLSYGTLYNLFGDRSYQFMLVRLVGVTIVGIFVGALQSHPLVQVIIILVVEIVETLTTALWLPYGENAAMGPLTFLFSVIRVVTAVLLLVMTPDVDIGRPTTSWIVYVIMGLHAIVFVIFFLILLVKIIELVVRALGHVPFDESKSRRATGLNGAIRRWDRVGGGKMRRRATIERKSREKLQHQQHNGQMEPQRSQSTGYETLKGGQARPHSPGLQGYEDEDGYIMAAMSGPRFGSQGYMPPGSYAAPASVNQSWHGDVSQPLPQQQNFAVAGDRRRSSSVSQYGISSVGRLTDEFAHRRSYSSNDQLSNSIYASPYDAPSALPRPQSYHAEVEFAGAPLAASSSPSLHPRLSFGPDLLSNSMSDPQPHVQPRPRKTGLLFGFLPRLGNRRQQEDDWSDDSDDDDDEPLRQSRRATGLPSFTILRSFATRRNQSTDVEEGQASTEAEAPAQKSFQVVRKSPQRSSDAIPESTPAQERPTNEAAAPAAAIAEDSSEPFEEEEPQRQPSHTGISSSIVKPPDL